MRSDCSLLFDGWFMVGLVLRYGFWVVAKLAVLLVGRRVSLVAGSRGVGGLGTVLSCVCMRLLVVMLWL